MKITALFIFLFISANLIAQYSSPESVTYDTTSRKYFISNTTSSKILQRSLTGKVTDFVTVGGSIHGITVYQNRVYICNGTRIKGYNLENSAEEFNVAISGSVFLNDLAIDNNGIMYITDFNGRRIYKLNLSSQQYWIYISNTVNTPNGIYIDAPRNRLLICCWGSNAPVKQVNLSDSSISNVITTPYGNCDGISLDRNDNVYISSWSVQSVVKYDINFLNPPVVVVNSLSNPADIFVNKNSDTLAIPNASNNTVTFHYLDNPSGVNSAENVIPESIHLYQNYPNPFNPNTKIRFYLSNSGFISLKLYNLKGQEIETLQEGIAASGYHEISFVPEGLSSSMYFYKLNSNDLSITRAMIFLK